MPTLTESKRKQARPRAKKEENSEVAKILRQHAFLRWFAVISMLAIISWVLIDLFGPVPKYQLSQRPQAELNSTEFVRELEALAASRTEPHTQIEALPNGVNFYEAELAAIQAAQKKALTGKLTFFPKARLRNALLTLLPSVRVPAWK